MSINELVQDYQRLLDTAQWLEVGMSWTVIQSLGEPMSVADVAERVAGPGAEVRLLDVAEGPLVDPAVHIADCGPSIMLLDHIAEVVSWVPGIMDRLSVGARLWNVCWHVNGGSRLVYAVDGRVLTEVPALDRDLAYGIDPHALDHVLHLLPDAYTLLSKATAMAIIEMESGAYLDLEWLEGEQMAVILGRVN
ncbi:hypothetical protein ACIBG8_25440 [Nonomuraea sp. NPDC050556]|uniref:hypothetical protein n=1 Tax=Nonomuraea sp. NPDC050556 TaxID=3364369 RepID=UPI0037A79381